MTSDRFGATAVRRALAACLLGSAVAVPPPARATPHEIVQQRLPDGSVVFSDRPQPGARTERSWQFTPDDPAIAEARREAAQRESAAVSERIARQIEAQRVRDLGAQLAQARAAQAAAERAAWQARAEADLQPVVVWPVGRRGTGWRPGTALPGDPPQPKNGIWPTPTVPTPVQPLRRSGGLQPSEPTR